MQTNTQDNDTSNVSEKSEQIREYGQIILKENNSQHHIFLLSIIGEIEGHEQSPGNVKTTKYIKYKNMLFMPTHEFDFPLQLHTFSYCLCHFQSAVRKDSLFPTVSDFRFQP